MKRNLVEEVHMSLINGQRRQMVKQINSYGLCDFFADYKEYLKGYELDDEYYYFTDCVISYNRITNR